MLSSVSVSSITSITTMLAIGVTAASVLLSFLFIGLVGTKELAVTLSDVDDRVKDSLNAAILPVLFAFMTLVVMQVL